MNLVINEKDKKGKYPSICLNMIVKNEAHIILTTFDNLLQHIDFAYWVISDTGSTDNTQEIIKDYFFTKGIPGELVNHEWKNFGYNRTKALEAAYGKTDYLLIFDADDKIEGNFKLPFKNEILDNNNIYADRYLLKFGKGFEYSRPLLMNNHKKWMFKGVLHEFLANLEPVNYDEVIKGDYYVDSGRSGNRSKNPNKYYDDAIILKNAYAEELLLPDKGLSGRYAFYCARSYTDAGEKYFAEAIEWYKKVMHIPNHWPQEKYYAALEIGKMYKHQNKNEEAIKYWLKTIEFDSERMEGVVQAMEYFSQTEQHVLVNALYHKFKNYKTGLHDKLFINQHLYNQRIEFFNAISAFYANDKETGYQCAKDILIKQTLNEHELNITLNNLLCYREILEKDGTSLSLFYAVDNIFARYNSFANNANNIESWNILFKQNRDREELTKYNKALVKKIRKIAPNTLATHVAPHVFISFTTCKRYDLFQATLNSLLNHWTDVDQINYWFCVDDNSSAEDRQKMKSSYDWITYYMKTPQEKGHRKSMNIIWQKLAELKPTYWIHMEDDFLFYYPLDYVGKAIKALTTLPAELKVKQILFNRNYAETIENYMIAGHVSTPLPDIVLHNHTNEKISNYQNAHYWPHYSFRPALIEVKTILALGNYDSAQQFFERDYADKWHKANYKSAFFNRITNRHIGRLTSERHLPNALQNAYQLNDEEQFIAKIKHVPCPLKIINLERRADRRQKMTDLFNQHNISPYEFIKANDGNELVSTLELKQLFAGNDFGSRRGVIGCALTHYGLWQQLLTDKENEYYLIFEDDITVGENMKERLNELTTTNQFTEKEVLFLGYSMFENKRNTVKHIYDMSLDLSANLNVAVLNKELYIGGFFAYSINKKGAQKMVDYIHQHGIKHGIDYLIKIINEIDICEIQPLIVRSEWNEDGKQIDTDIQRNYESLDFNNLIEEQFVFIPHLDQIGHDTFFQKAALIENMKRAMKLTDTECVGFNTLGFFKNKIVDLTSSCYFGEKDGIYVKKSCYATHVASAADASAAVASAAASAAPIRVKMLCNWCSSETLCKEWANMCQTGYKWKNIEITWEDIAIDYYVIINYPQSPSSVYQPERTLVFQMEPYVQDPKKEWGVKTWCEWADPDQQEKKFLKVFTHKKHLNNVQWQINYPFHAEPIKQSEEKTKYDRVATICSSKNYDEGHILRNNFIKFVDKTDHTKSLDVFGKQNYHNFTSYVGPIPLEDDKYNVYANYKYCFTAENNWEHNYATEKIWECILCEALCFYWGCPNLEEYIDSRAFVRLPLEDPAAALKIMQQAVAEDWWTQRIGVIKEMKEKILHQLGFFPLLESIFIK